MLWKRIEKSVLPLVSLDTRRVHERARSDWTACLPSAKKRRVTSALVAHGTVPRPELRAGVGCRHPRWRVNSGMSGSSIRPHRSLGMQRRRPTPQRLPEPQARMWGLGGCSGLVRTGHKLSIGSEIIGFWAAYGSLFSRRSRAGQCGGEQARAGTYGRRRDFRAGLPRGVTQRQHHPGWARRSLARKGWRQGGHSSTTNAIQGSDAGKDRVSRTTSRSRYEVIRLCFGSELSWIPALADPHATRIRGQRATGAKPAGFDLVKLRRPVDLPHE